MERLSQIIWTGLTVITKNLREKTVFFQYLKWQEKEIFDCTHQCEYQKALKFADVKLYLHHMCMCFMMYEFPPMYSSPIIGMYFHIY